MNETKKERRKLGGEEREGGRKEKKKKSLFYLDMFRVNNNRTIHDLNWKTQRQK